MRRRRLWWTFAAGLSCIAAGDVVYALYERVLHDAAPFPYLADALYLAGCPLIGLSLVGLVRLLAGLGARLPALRLLAGACALWLADDTVYAVVLQYGTYDQGLLIDIPWLLGFVLFGATGLHPSMAALTQPVAQPTTRLTGNGWPSSPGLR